MKRTTYANWHSPYLSKCDMLWMIHGPDIGVHQQHFRWILKGQSGVYLTSDSIDSRADCKGACNVQV